MLGINYIQLHSMLTMHVLYIYKCQPVWIKTMAKKSSGLIWIQTVSKDYRQVAVKYFAFAFIFTQRQKLNTTSFVANFSEHNCVM